MKQMTLETPRATIKGIEMSEKDAKARGYGYYFTDKEYDIYTRTDCDTWHTEFAFVRK